MTHDEHEIRVKYATTTGTERPPTIDDAMYVAREAHRTAERALTMAALAVSVACLAIVIWSCA